MRAKHAPFLIARSSLIFILIQFNFNSRSFNRRPDHQAKMALFSRRLSQLGRSFSTGFIARAAQPAVVEKLYGAGVDDKLFGLTEDQVQVG